MYPEKLNKILFLLLLLPLVAKPIVFDSLAKEKLIEQGIYKLNKLKNENQQKIAEGKTNELNFIVNINPDNTDYINDYNLTTKPKFLNSTSLEQTLNTRLQQVYSTKQKECYLILISAFDVEINAPIPSGTTIQDVFNGGKFFNEHTDIETHKDFHKDVVTQIVSNSGILTTNRNCYILSSGAYCGAFFNNELGCYYYWFSTKINKTTNPAVPHFEETYDYLNTFLANNESFKHPTSRDNIAEQMVGAFESAAKNAEQKALILTTHTPSAMEGILSNFTTSEDYYTLTLAERIHILKVFLTPLTFTSSENYINKVLKSTLKTDVNNLLNALLDPQHNINGSCLLYKLFTGMQLGNYATCVKELCTLVGRSSLDDKNLPIDNTSYSGLQLSQFTPNDVWKRTFEWTDCWNRINPQNANDPNNVSLNTCTWNNLEKRFTSITLANNGDITVNGYYDTGAEYIVAAGTPTPSQLTQFSHSLHPYDLVVFINKSGIESINEATTNGVVVVPALFLKFAIDKSFNQGLYDAAMLDISILSIVGVDELFLASKVLSRIPKFKSLVKWMRGGEVVAGGAVAGEVVDWVAQRTSFWDDWINKCFPGKNWSNTTFTTKGKDYNSFKSTHPTIYNDMKALNSNEIKLQEFIEAGSTIPIKVPINQGDEFYKIVPKGNNIGGPSAYYVDQAQLNLIKNNPEFLEKILGLPLGSVNAEYDVFKITYKGTSGYVFKSTVANTEQYANITPTLKYNTSGGATQTLILDNMEGTKWLKGASPIESIAPNQLPQIEN